MAKITLQHEDINLGQPVKIYANQVRITGKRNVSRNPNVNNNYPVEVQTHSVENHTIVIQGVMFDGLHTELTQEDCIKLLTAKYTGGNAAILNVEYGKAGQKRDLIALENTKDIKVVLETYDYPISTSDTRDGYMPIGSLTFTETK